MKNQVRLIGHAGADAEVKTGSNGTKYARFSMATNDYVKNSNGENMEVTEWHSVKTFGKMAENTGELVKKGTELMVEGRLHYSSVTDEAGNKKMYAEIIARELVVISSRAKKSEAA
jgi:single-strand DNA-binding protein